MGKYYLYWRRYYFSKNLIHKIENVGNIIHKEYFMERTMENDKMKNIKECILKEAENVIIEYVNKDQQEEKNTKENLKLKKKLKKQRWISIFLFVLLIITVILKK